MDNNIHALIVGDVLTNVRCNPPDVIAVSPGATLIFSDDWDVLVTAYGDESRLFVALGIIKDERWQNGI